MEHVVGLVLMGFYAVMGSVLIYKMIHTIVGLVSRSVLDNLGAPFLCVIMVGDSSIKLL